MDPWTTLPLRFMQMLLSLCPEGAACAQSKIGGFVLNEGYFSGQSLKLMPLDALISAQNAPKCVWRQAPPEPAGAGGAHGAPPDPLAGFKGFYCKEKGGGNAPNFVSTYL